MKAEAAYFSRFSFHENMTASTSSFRIHISGLNFGVFAQNMDPSNNRKAAICFKMRERLLQFCALPFPFIKSNTGSDCGMHNQGCESGIFANSFRFHISLPLPHLPLSLPHRFTKVLQVKHDQCVGSR